MPQAGLCLCFYIKSQVNKPRVIQIVMVSFLESLPLGSGNLSMHWDLISDRSPKSLSFHACRSTCKTQGKQIRDIAHSHKRHHWQVSTDPAHNFFNVSNCSFQGWLQLSLCFDAPPLLFCKQSYELLFIRLTFFKFRKQEKLKPRQTYKNTEITVHLRSSFA